MTPRIPPIADQNADDAPPARGGDFDESPEASLELHPVWLLFRDPALENQFMRETISESLVFIRIAIALAPVLYLTLGVMSKLPGADPLWIFYITSGGFVCPILLVAFALTFWRGFYRVSQIALGAVMITNGLSVIALTAIIPWPANGEYFVGVVIVVTSCGSMVHLKFVSTQIISVLLVLCYQLSAVILNPIPTVSLISNDFFLAMAMGAGIFSGYIREMHSRKSYISQKIVEKKNELTNRLLAEAYSSNRSKSEFLANMSHELRTPLNAIIGFSEIFAKELIGPLGTPKYVEYAHDIHSSGVHLLTIINDLLDLAKAESGKLELSDDEVNVVRVLQRAIRMCEQRAQQHGLTVVLMPERDPMHIIADEKLLLQLLLNLLSNAVKFTPAHGSITITAEANPRDGIIIAMTDTGIGIPEEDLDRIMRPFEQIENSYTRKFKGTGLGLPYALRVAELHGGKLKIESAVTEGTTVRLWLPASRIVSDCVEAPGVDRKAS